MVIVSTIDSVKCNSPLREGTKTNMQSVYLPVNFLPKKLQLLARQKKTQSTSKQTSVDP